jgi:NH3-dependent NAD+ synthetase
MGGRENTLFPLPYPHFCPPFFTHRNKKEQKDIIPKNVFVKPPSAELRPNQRDENSVSPYPVLDPILQVYVGEDKGYKILQRWVLKKT